MQNVDHSSHNSKFPWSRDEINVWLESLNPWQQDFMRALGRKWANRGEDLVRNFSYVRKIIEENGGVFPTQPPTFQSQPLVRPHEGFWTKFRKLVLVWRDFRIDNNLRNLGRDLNDLKSMGR